MKSKPKATSYHLIHNGKPAIACECGDWREVITYEHTQRVIEHQFLDKVHGWKTITTSREHSTF